MSPQHVAQRVLLGFLAFTGTRFGATVSLIGGAALGASVAVAAWPQPHAASPAASLTGSAAEAAPTRPCDQQTWPYLDASCLKAGAGPLRQARLISEDREVSDTHGSVPARVNPVAQPAQIAAVATTLAHTMAQSPTKPQHRVERRKVVVHDMRKVARDDSRRTRYRLARPYDIAPGHDGAGPGRRWNDTSRHVMAYGDDQSAGARTFFVPFERGFGREPF